MQPAADWAALRDQPYALLAALETRLRAARSEAARSELKFWTGVGFRLGQQWWLAPREDVREVAAPPRLTRLPGARPWLLGVGNLRGSVLPVTDLARLLGLPPAGPDPRLQRLLVLEDEGGAAAGFLVDEVLGPRQFGPADQRGGLAETLAAPARRWLLGGFHREGRDWRVVSLKRIARSDEFLHAGT